MSATKEQKPKAVLFYISHSLFKNKRLKRRLVGDNRKKTPKKRPKTKRKSDVNGRVEKKTSQMSETIEISTDEEYEPAQLSNVETSIVLSSGDEDEEAAKSRIFPMLASETMVRTAVGNKVYELSLTKLKKKLDTITPKESKEEPPNKRLSSPRTMDVSISLLSDDEEDNNLDSPETTKTKVGGLTVTLGSSTK